MEARALCIPHKVGCRMQLVQDVLHEQFRCSECDQAFATQAALRRHVFREHMTEEQQDAKRQDNTRQLRAEIMEHAREGMPECRHCGHKFTTWHSFYNHINTQSCSVLRALKLSPLKVEIMPTLNDAVIENSSIVEFAGQGSWKDIALHPLVQQKHHHCMECNQWHVKTQYVKRHMLLRHPQHRKLIERAEQLAVEGNLSLSNPCQFCGQRYQRKSAHLKACVGVFSGVYLYLRIGRGPQLKALGDDFRHGSGRSGQKVSPGSHEGAGHAESSGPGRSDDGTTGNKLYGSSLSHTAGVATPTAGDGQGGISRQGTEIPQAGHQGSDGQGSAEGSAVGQVPAKQGLWKYMASTSRMAETGTQDDPQGGEGPKGEPRQMGRGSGARRGRGLRHPVPPQDGGDAPPPPRVPALHKQDRLRFCGVSSHRCASEPRNQHVSSCAGVARHQNQNTGALECSHAGRPDERMQKMMETPSSRSTAVSLGWLTEDEKAITGLRWNPESRTHVRDEQIKPIEIQEVKEALEELVVLVKEPMVVARYHATRPLSEQYQSPNLTMLMEIGLRTEQSHQAWKHLHKLKQSAVWVAAGAFMRQERIQRSPLAQKLAALIKY